MTFRAATVTQIRSSQTTHQELISLADAESSLGIARVLDAAPASTEFGLVTRPVGYSTTVNVSSIAGVVNVQQNSTVWQVQISGTVAVQHDSTIAAFAASLVSSAVLAGNSSALNVRNVWSSTHADQPVYARVFNSTAADLQATVTPVAGSTWSVRPLQSSQADLRVTVYQSTAADLNVTVAGYSTLVAVSTASVTLSAIAAAYVSTAVLAGNSSALNVRPVWSSTNTDQPVSARVFQSTIADLKATVAQNSTVWAVQAAVFDGAGNALESSTSAPSTGARGLIVRPVINGIATYAASTAGQSSVTTILSSAAANKAFVFAYSITSTLAGPIQWGFYAGATLLWTGVLAATSSAVSGANLAVSPPGFLFKGSTGGALTFNCATSNAGLSVSLAYWQST